MKRLATIGVLLAVTCWCSAADGTGDGYRLVWADEFEVDGRPDPKRWTNETGFIRNGELQWYQPENATCKGGRLVIEGRREHKPNPLYKPGNNGVFESRKFVEYTSASLTTKGLHSWRYGRFEVKARIRARPGLWPAIWFLGTEGRWPECGEIDLMECYGGHLWANACWGSAARHQATWDSFKIPVQSLGDPGWDGKFHVWRMDWDSESIKLFVDDRLLNTIDLARTLNAGDLGPKNPFQHPHYMLLNLAIGGTSGGDPSGTAFPTTYEIEYVRVYQRSATRK